MPRYKYSEVNHIVSYEECKALVRVARDVREKTWVIMLWLTGARPSELLEMTKDDITIEETRTSFTIRTKKLKKTGEFLVEKRHLVLHIIEDDVFIKIINRYLKRLREGSRIFQFSRQTGNNILERVGYDALGIKLCPYNFRHSRMTLLAEKGASIEELKRFKGARTDHSVRPYLHARKVEYSVEVDL